MNNFNLDNKLVNQINSHGIAKVRNFLDFDEIKDVKEILNFYKKPKSHPDTIFPVKTTNYLVKLLKLDVRKILFSLKLNQICKKKKLMELSDEFFKTSSKLNMIDGYYAKKSNANILEWHCDQPFFIDDKIENRHDNRSLKVFIYLTKVFKDNGCMSYIPGSQKFVYQIKKLIFEKKIPLIKLKFLSDLNSWLDNKYNFELIQKNIDNEILNDFLKSINFLKKNKDTNQFDYEMNEGDAIIFDENGFHKGTKTLFTDRLVLRYHFSRKSKI